MKIIEIKQVRDYYIANFIGLFLIMTNFFYAQSILTAAYMLLVVIVISSSLISLNDRDNVLKTSRRLYLSGSMLMQSLPLMIVIFILFPRVSGPLWGLPKDAHSGLSGISDEMSPGTISRLTLSDEIAFRVEFDGQVPENSALYWRGPVLWHTDGVKWVGKKSHQVSTTLTTKGKPVTYTVTLEATDKKWLYGLEIPVSAPENSYLSDDLQLKTKTPVRSRIQYKLTSFTEYSIGANSHVELIQALQLPQGRHKMAIALGSSWRESGLDDIEIVNRALQMFNQEKFYYTLAPPLLPYDTVDQFLFETRQGFCEHYASSFVILMRAAGIPARVVTGYQGGAINPVGNYLVVRQRDAHAWTEVWLEKSGWSRIDPPIAPT